jgi:hypothetical protein
MALLSHTVRAQSDSNLFNHLGGGIGVGLDGIGFELATPVTKFLAVRAGMSFLPRFKYSEDLDVNDNATTTDKVPVEGKLTKTDFKLLVDFYPFHFSALHITAGAFVGGKKLINAYNTKAFINDPADYGTVGIKLGDYQFTSDEQGNVEANIEVASFKPYLGIGFGRAVPMRTRISVAFDLGVQFWGSPKVYSWSRDKMKTKGEAGWLQYSELTKNDVDDKSGKKALDIISKISVWPVLNIRLTGRFF